MPLLRATSAGPSSLRGPQMPVVDVLHPIPAKHWARNPVSLSTIRQIKAVRDALHRQHYDICIDLQGAVRSAWIGRMAASQCLVGEANPREPIARWLFHKQVETRGVHVIEQAREVVAAAVQEYVREALPNCPAALPIDSDAEHWCEEWLRERDVKQFVLMNPGAGWGAKRWPIERYASVAQDLARMGFASVVNVGPGESGLAESICADTAAAFAMSGSIGQLIACTRRACLFIGGDTGPLHLAAALKIPVVGIYGPTDPARNGPYETCARILRHPASERDHTRRSEPEAGLLTITVHDVLEAAKSLLHGEIRHAREISRMNQHGSRSLFKQKWKQTSRRIRVPLGFLFVIFYFWLARPLAWSLLASILLVVPGILLRSYASGYVKKNAELATTGPYAYTRNPLYVGSILIAFGFALAARSVWIALALTLLFLVIYWPVILGEEEYLRTHFAGYDDYARRVPRLLPRLRKPGDSVSGKFSLELYRKHREYNSLLGTFCIYLALIARMFLFH